MKRIVDDYLDGDLSDRVGLFLGYRDQRAEFMAIELDEAREADAQEAGPESWWQRLWQRAGARLARIAGAVWPGV